MENSYLIDTVLESNFWNYFSDFIDAAYILSFIVLTFFAFLLTIIYKKVRRKFPLKVNCWFCNNNTTVPYESSNSWDCPHCNQYNGFEKDGDYNKIIPEQFNHKLNGNIFTNIKSQEKNGDVNSWSNGFCELCNINQQLKIQQLALFVPLDENNYYEEIEQYREKLEKAYKLCSKCENTLKETLQKQEYNILRNRLKSHKQNIASQRLGNFSKFQRWRILASVKNKIISKLKFTCIVIGILLFLALINQYETENQFLNLALPDFIFIEPSLPFLKVVLNYLEIIFNYKKEISFAGAVIWLLSDLNKQKINDFCLALWGFSHLSTWTPFTGLQLLLCGICLVSSVKGVHNKFIYLNKKSLPQKSGYQPIKKIFPEIYNNTNENLISSNSLKADDFDLNNDLIDNKFQLLGEKLTENLNCMEKKKKIKKKKENEIELLPNDEKMEAKVLKSSPRERNSSPLFLEPDKNFEDLNGSFSEVYNNLNSLHLGGKQKKSNKPANYLFSNHNFSDVKNSFSIIKPGKLVKNLNSNSWTESNECNSRSSTPSSGYSSQKPEPSRYDYPKALTPLSLNSFSRLNPNYYDHYDGNHLFYNNVNCFSPGGFVPFQQYPGPMGHTTIYTCTRPSNFAFPFSPCPPPFPTQKFSPGSNRFSDASDQNLFQDSSKTFEKNKKWCKFKSFLYYFSIFLNITTVMTFIFFISTGIVLVDWKLPKFNFFI